jgi:hypothetical protein
MPYFVGSGAWLRGFAGAESSYRMPFFRPLQEVVAALVPEQRRVIRHCTLSDGASGSGCEVRRCRITPSRSFRVTDVTV